MQRFLQIFKIRDLRNKILIVLGLLVAFRALAAIPIPGIDAEQLRNFFAQNEFLGFLNLFSGGGLSNLSVAMLGVGPYITATIIMQLMTMIFPKFKQLYYEEGERGRAKFNQYSRLLTVPLAAAQAYGFLTLLTVQGAIPAFGFYAALTNVIIVTSGTMLVLWIGELISEQKIGNGVSLIIVAGIVSGLPGITRGIIDTYTPDVLPTYIGFAVLAIVIISGIVYLNEGERKVPITYARRVRGMKMFGGVSSYLPLKVNQAGMIPLIFAISVLLFPQVFAQIVTAVSPGFGARLNEIVTNAYNNQFLYGSLYFLLVVAFTYFYTAITFDPKEISKNLQRSGGFVPGIRPGEATGHFFSHIIKRVTFFGAMFLGLIAILPLIIAPLTGVSLLNISGTALLIVVAVALETMRQIDSQLTVREYEGLR